MRVFSVILITVLLLCAVFSCDQDYHVEMVTDNNQEKIAASLETVPDEVGNAAGPVSVTQVYRITLVSDATESVSSPALLEPTTVEFALGA